MESNKMVIIGASGYSPSRNNRGTRRIPYISNTAGAPGIRKNDQIFCKLCGHSMNKVQSFHALVCSNCGAIDDLPMTEQEIKAKQQQESSYTVADGSLIYNPDDYSSYGLRQRKHFVTPGGITRKIPSVEEKFRDSQRSDAERIMDYESDRLVNDRHGGGAIKITSRVDVLDRSKDIISAGDDLIASKGNIDLRSSTGGAKIVRRNSS